MSVNLYLTRKPYTGEAVLESSIHRDLATESEDS